MNGGAEIMFGNIKSHEIDTEKTGGPSVIEDLIIWLRDNKLKAHAELFMTGSHLRPGLLLLINEVDWELLEKEKYKIKEGDCIEIISTLHGG
ncbi:hypothetical protein HZS_1357 [Henneguya salminicola]|nr:hypothetical protein HZS_1357 [Henneguya salminicola]